jgi:hypothetical protein
MKNKISLRQSTQFPPTHEIDENTTYKKTWLDETGLTSNGLVQVLNYLKNEVILQYLRVNGNQIALHPTTSFEDAITKLEECIELVKE